MKSRLWTVLRVLVDLTAMTTVTAVLACGGLTVVGLAGLMTGWPMGRLAGLAVSAAGLGLISAAAVILRYIERANDWVELRRPTESDDE